MPIAVSTPVNSIEFSDISGPDPDRVYYVIGGVPQSRPILKGKDAKVSAAGICLWPVWTGVDEIELGRAQPTFSAIPEISLADLSSPSPERRKALATKIRNASRDVGFFVATDSPVNPELIGKFANFTPPTPLLVLTR